MKNQILISIALLLPAASYGATGTTWDNELWPTTPDEYTTATGVVTYTGSATSGEHVFTIDTESDAASDEVDTISGTHDGHWYLVRPADDARTVVLKDGTGNLVLGGDVSLDDIEDTVILYDSGTNLELVASSHNQQITDLSLSGNTLQITLENDEGGQQTLNLTSILHTATQDYDLNGYDIIGAGSLDVGTQDVTTFQIGGVTVTATATELNYVDGVTSNVQTQLDNKQDALGAGDIGATELASTGVTPGAYTSITGLTVDADGRITSITGTSGDDVTAPTLSSATIDGTSLVLTYDEAVSQGASYSDGHLDLDMSSAGADIAVTYSSGDGTTAHTYTAASAASDGEAVNLDFDGTANSLEDSAGNNLATIDSFSVINNTTPIVGLLVDEDFSETGRPTGNTWTDVTGTPDYDATTHSLTGEALEIDSDENARVSIGSTARYAKFRWDTASGNNGGATHTIFAFEQSDGSDLLALRLSNTEAATVYSDGTEGTFSSTFSVDGSTIYYVWFDWVPSGTCYIGISESDSRPVPGTDTATAWAATKTGGSGTVDQYLFKPAASTGKWYVDDVQIDADPIQVIASVIDTTEGDAVSSVSHDFTAAESGDIIGYSVSHRGAISNPAAPSGWTELAEVATGTGAGDCRLTTYYKVADGTETTVTLTMSTAQHHAVVSWLVKGSDGTAPSYATDTSEGTSYTLASATVPTNGLAMQIVSVHEIGNSDTLGEPSSVDSLGLLTSYNAELSVSYEDASGATGTLDYTYGTYAQWAAMHLVFDQ